MKAFLCAGTLALQFMLSAGAASAACTGPLLSGPVTIHISDSNITVRGKDAKPTDGAFLVGPPAIGEELENISGPNDIRIRHRASQIVCEQPIAVLVTKPTAHNPFSSTAISGCLSKTSSIQNDLFIIANAGHLSQAQAWQALRGWSESIAKTASERNIWELLSSSPPVEAPDRALRHFDPASTYQQYIYSRIEAMPRRIVISRSYGMLCEREQVEDNATGMLNRAVEASATAANAPAPTAGAETQAVTANAAPDQESLALTQRAFALIEAKRAPEALPLLDQAIAAEEKFYANEKRQIFCARTPQETLSYALRGATAKKETVVVGPTWALAVFLKGFGLIEAGRAEEARAYLERAVELSPSNSQYLSELGEWHKSHKDWTPAYALFQRASDAAGLTAEAAARTREKGRALRGMGFVLTEEGKLDDAEKLYRECLELDPNDAGAKHELDYISQQRAKAAARAT